MPVAVRSMRRFSAVTTESAHVLVRKVGDNPLRADIDIVDPSGLQLISLSGVEFRPVSRPRRLESVMEQVFYEPEWELGADAPDPSPAHADSGFGLVVSLGAATESRVQALAAAYRHRSQVYSIVDPDPDAIHDDIVEILRSACAIAGSNRINVVVVVGTGLSASQNVLALARIAAAVGTVSAESTDAGEPPEIDAVIVTEHALCTPGDSSAADLSHAGLVGARRALYNEQPRILWRLIDVESATPSEDLIREVLNGAADNGEQVDEVCLRMGSRFVTRVRRNLADYRAAQNLHARVQDNKTSFALEVPDTRLLADLAWREVDRTPPGEGQVEVRMDAVGLNYKDPLKVLGLLDAEELDGTRSGMAIGLEGMGTVVRVGAGVDDLVPGTQVLVSAPDIVQRYVTVQQLDCTEVPAHWAPGTCSSNVPFLTAEFGLLDAGRIRPGDTVLIHGAAGGVGLAAIQVARLHGARVIATASTEERRQYVLRAGAHEALDSRTLNYVDDVLRLTDGRGVDVVFNTAPGEVVQQNFRAAAEFGRIIEIGKADIYRGNVIDLRPFDRNLSLMALDLDRMMTSRRTEIDERREQIVAKLESGVYRHLEYQTYSMHEVSAAFNAVLRSDGIGRVVLDLSVDDPVARPKNNGVGIRSDAQYLLTGGFGAFGLATARWLVDNGARHLTLAGRTGAGSAYARDQIAEFRTMGVSVTQEAVDVSDFAAVAGLVSRTHRSDIPLRGVYHAAGVVDDTAIPAITAETLTKVFAPKADGAVNLDRAVCEAGHRVGPLRVVFIDERPHGWLHPDDVLGGQRHAAGGRLQPASTWRAGPLRRLGCDGRRRYGRSHR